MSIFDRQRSLVAAFCHRPSPGRHAIRLSSSPPLDCHRFTDNFINKKSSKKKSIPPATTFMKKLIRYLLKIMQPTPSKRARFNTPSVSPQTPNTSNTSRQNLPSSAEELGLFTSSPPLLQPALPQPVKESKVFTSSPLSPQLLNQSLASSIHPFASRTSY